MRPILLAALALAPLLAPAATAQGPGLHVANVAFDDPIAPGAAESRELAVSVPCDAIGARAELRLATRRAEPWLAATFDPASTLLEGADCVGDRATATPTMRLAVAPGAPALADGAIEVEAVLVREGESPLTDRNTFVARAAYVGRVSVEPPSAPRMGKPQSVIDFAVTVTNLGNGPTRVTFSIVNATPRWVVPQPPPINVEGAAFGGEPVKQTLPFAVQTPFQNGQNSDAAIIVVRWTSAYALDPFLTGTSGVFELRAFSEGVYTPAPGGLLALAALGACGALLARKRSRDV